MSWRKSKITLENGTAADAQFPLIVSASRSTDIPADTAVNLRVPLFPVLRQFLHAGIDETKHRRFLLFTKQL